MRDAMKRYEGFNITINTTEDCNLACKYCYEINKKPRTIQVENAKKFIDLILSEDDFLGLKGTDKEWMLDNGLMIEFLGGDSLS